MIRCGLHPVGGEAMSQSEYSYPGSLTDRPLVLCNPQSMRSCFEIGTPLLAMPARSTTTFPIRAADSSSASTVDSISLQDSLAVFGDAAHSGTQPLNITFRPT